MEPITHTTRPVTIKVLRLGHTPMTEHAFRQLPQRAVIDTQTGALLGTPLGHVNYFWGDCQPGHLHVVWLDGETLYRDCVFDPMSAPLAALDQLFIEA